MTDTSKTVFVTMFALHGGIMEASVQRLCPSGKAHVHVPADTYIEAAGEAAKVSPGPAGVTLFLGPPHFQLTREAAVTRANQMRDAKLRSLEAQAERLRGMVFG